MKKRSARRPAGPAPAAAKRWGGTMALAAAIGLAVFLISMNAKDYIRTITHYNELGRQETAAADLSRDGVERRSIFLDIDCQMWNLFASQLAAGDSLRIRRTDFDNHPWGREVHWSSGYAWLLVVAGKMRQLFSQEDPRSAIERASIFVNPLLHMALIALVAAVVARRLFWLAGVLAALALAGSSTVLHSFHAGGPDHHSLITATAVGAGLCLFLGGGGFVQRLPPAGVPPGQAPGFPTREEARRWFVASGLFAGAGLWVSAITMSLFLVAVGVAAVVGLFFYRGSAQDPTVEPAPEIWLRWGISGAAAGLFFYLFEYFPADMGLRLEVNNPLYHLALLGGSWLLVSAGRLRFLGSRPRGAAWAGIAASAAALAPLPFLVYAGGEKVHALKNELLWRWHENIFEFHPMDWAAFVKQFGAMILVLVLAVAYVLGAKLARERRAWCALACSVPLVPLGLTLWQQRWGSLLAVALVLPPVAGLIAAASVSPGNPSRLRRWWKPALLAALLTGQVVYQWSAQLSYAAKLRAGQTSDVRLEMFAAAREMAESIRRTEGGSPVVLLSTPWPTVVMGYSGDFKGIGSLYWENLAGLQAVADILTETDDDKVLRLVQERGITHMAFMQSDYNVDALYYNKHGRRPSAAESDRMFGNRLTNGKWPWWVRQLRYRSAIPRFSSNPLFYGGAIFRIDPRAVRAPGRP